MKKLTIILCTTLLCLIGCNRNNNPEEDKYGEKGTGYLFSNKETPAWQAPTNYDYTSSMTVVIQISKLNGTPIKPSAIGDGDVMAAFVGDSCCGKVEPIDGLFFLFITQPNSPSDDTTSISQLPITVRYYSAHYKNIFVAEAAFTYKSATHLGTDSEPIEPDFLIERN